MEVNATRIFTMRALEWSFSGVDTNVLGQVLALPKALWAEMAGVWPRIAVNHLVPSNQCPCAEFLRT